MKKTIIAALIASTIAIQAPVASAADATLGYQIVQQGTLIEQYSTQARQLQQQIALLQDAYRNSTGLPIQAWGSAQNYINELTGILSQAEGLSYGSTDVLQQVQQTYGDGSLLPDYPQRIEQWNKNIMSQVSSVLRVYNAQVNTSLDTQNKLNTIMNASQTAQGRMQVLQASNQIASIAVNELQNLQTIVMAGNQAQLNHLATVTAKEQQSKEDAKRFLQKSRGKW